MPAAGFEGDATFSDWFVTPIRCPLDSSQKDRVKKYMVRLVKQSILPVIGEQPPNNILEDLSSIPKPDLLSYVSYLSSYIFSIH